MYTLTITSTGSVDGTLASSGFGSGDPSSGRGYILMFPLKKPMAPTSSGSLEPLPRVNGNVLARSVKLQRKQQFSKVCRHLLYIIYTQMAIYICLNVTFYSFPPMW